MIALVNEGQSPVVRHDTLRAIGFWMSVVGSNPIQPVRVLISYEALSQLDPTNVRDLPAAFEHFDKFRSRIETAASKIFDRGSIEPEKWENMPLIRLNDTDPI
jgi:hypothetical protein